MEWLGQIGNDFEGFLAVSIVTDKDYAGIVFNAELLEFIEDPSDVGPLLGCRSGSRKK